MLRSPTRCESACLLLLLALLGAFLIPPAAVGEDREQKPPSVLEYYTSLPDEPSAEQDAKLLELLKAERSIAPPAPDGKEPWRFDILAFPSLLPYFIQGEISAKSEENRGGKGLPGTRISPRLKGFHLLRSFILCFLDAVPKEGPDRARCLFAASQMLGFLDQEITCIEVQPGSAPEGAVEIGRACIGLLEHSGLLEQLDDALLAGVRDVTIQGATFKEKIVSWREAVNAAPKNLFRLMGLELRLIEFATPEVIFSQPLPPVFHFDTKTYLRTVVRDYISRDYLPEPPWLALDTVEYENDVASEIALRVAGMYLVPPILAGDDKKLRRWGYVCDICRIYGHSLWTNSSHRLYVLYRPILVNAVKWSAAKSWRKRGPTWKYHKVAEGLIEDVMFIGEYRLSGRGKTLIESDHIFPNIIFTKGNHMLAQTNYDSFFSHIDDQELSMGGTEFFTPTIRMQDLSRYSWAVPPIPVGIEVEYDYTDEGLARLAADAQLMKRIRRGIYGVAWGDFDAALLKRMFHPAVYYTFHKCRYEVRNLVLVSDVPGAEVDVPVAALFVFPCEGEKPVSVTPSLLCNKVDPWIRKFMILRDHFSWHLDDLRDREEVKPMLESVRHVSDKLAGDYPDRWKVYCEKEKAGEDPQDPEPADLGLRPGDGFNPNEPPKPEEGAAPCR